MFVGSINGSGASTAVSPSQQVSNVQQGSRVSETISVEASGAGKISSGPVEVSSSQLLPNGTIKDLTVMFLFEPSKKKDDKLNLAALALAAEMYNMAASLQGIQQSSGMNGVVGVQGVGGGMGGSMGSGAGGMGGAGGV